LLPILLPVSFSLLSFTLALYLSPSLPSLLVLASPLLSVTLPASPFPFPLLSLPFLSSSPYPCPPLSLALLKLTNGENLDPPAPRKGDRILTVNYVDVTSPSNWLEADPPGAASAAWNAKVRKILNPRPQTLDEQHTPHRERKGVRSQNLNHKSLSKVSGPKT
jgi:hypothetical protein